MFRFKLSGFVHWGKLPLENLSKSELYNEPAERRKISKKNNQHKNIKNTEDQGSCFCEPKNCIQFLIFTNTFCRLFSSWMIDLFFERNTVSQPTSRHTDSVRANGAKRRMDPQFLWLPYDIMQ